MLCSVIYLPGLWLVSRTPVDPANTAIMRAVAVQLGFDLTGLEDMVQNGCTYGQATAPAPAQG